MAPAPLSVNVQRLLYEAPGSPRLACDAQARDRHIHGIVGPRGSGKSTLLRVLSVRPSRPRSLLAWTFPYRLEAHEDEVAGARLLAQPSEVQRRTGLVIGTQTAPEPSWSAGRYLRFFGRLYGMGRWTVERRQDALQETVRLRGGWEDEAMGRMSPERRRKVDIARALLHDPRVLLVDDPLHGLDLVGRDETREVLFDALDGSDTLSIVIGTSDVVELRRLCDTGQVLLRGENHPLRLRDGARVRGAWPVGDATERAILEAITPRPHWNEREAARVPRTRRWKDEAKRGRAAAPAPRGSTPAAIGRASPGGSTGAGPPGGA